MPKPTMMQAMFVRAKTKLCNRRRKVFMRKFLLRKRDIIPTLSYYKLICYRYLFKYVRNIFILDQLASSRLSIAAIKRLIV